MSSILNRVRQTITSPTGSGGPLVLNSTAFSLAHTTILSAGGVDQAEYCYVIEEGTDFEIQRGIWTLSSNQIARNTPIMSSISGTVGTTKMTLAGNATIRVIIEATDLGTLRTNRVITSADAIVDSDAGSMILANSASALALSLAAPSGNSFRKGWMTIVKNIFTGAATITASGASITSNGASSSAIVLQQYESLFLISSGVNYFALVIYNPIWSAAASLSASQQSQARVNIGVDTATTSKSSNYTVVGTDNNSLLLLSSAATLSFTAAATLGDKFKVRVRNTNTSTGLWTLDPNSSETIDGKTTLTLGIGEEMDIYCDGTSFYTSASRGKLVELWRQTASASAQIDFDFASGFPSDFDEFEIHIINAITATNDTYMLSRIKTTGSLTVQSTVYLYSARYQTSGGGADGGSTVDSITTGVPISRPSAGSGMGNSSGYALNGIIRLTTPNSSLYQTIEGKSSWLRYDGISYAEWIFAGGWISTAVPITGFRLLQSSGNIASGTFVLNGIRK